MSDDTLPADDIPQPEPDKLDPMKPKILTRVTLRKFEGDDTSGPPIETQEIKDPGFDDLVAQIEKEYSNATD